MFSFLRTVFLLSWILPLSAAWADLHVYILVNKENRGDYNQLLGIQEAFKKLIEKDQNIKDQNIKDQKIRLKEFDAQNISKIPAEIKSLSSNDKILILASGNQALKSITDLQQVIPPSQHKIWYGISSHQITKNLDEGINKINFIALPRHAVTPAFLGLINKSSTHLIQTVGVSHNLSQADILSEYNKAKEEKTIPQANKYIGLVLAGDAPDSEGKIHHFTKEEAKRLAAYISDFLVNNDDILLITNGPRTGKHIPNTEKIDTNAHKKGHMDQISATFLTALKEELTRKNIPLNRFAFFDFQDGSPSLIKAIFGAVFKTNGRLYLPGESISMISEGVDTVGKGFITVYKNQAMSEFHHKYVKVENDHGRINLISDAFQLEAASSTPAEPFLSNESASQFIARTMYNEITK